MQARLQVRLRDPLESDLPILFEQQRDPEAYAMAAFPTRDWDTFVAHWTKMMRDDSVVKKTIVAGDAIAGNIGAWTSTREPALRLIGYWIGRTYWGRGIATHAVAEILRLTSRPLHAFVAKHNVASIRVLEKNGFSIVREQRSHDFGMEVDEVLMKLG